MTVIATRGNIFLFLELNQNVIYNLEFRVGKRAHVRIPGDVCFDESCRIMPRMTDGAQEVIVGLTKSEMAKLEADWTWRGWIECAGRWA